MAVSFTHCLQNLGLYSRSHLSCQRDSLEGKSHHVVNACLQKSGYDLAMNSKVGLLLDSVKWDEKGLAVAIAQNVDTGAILMQGFANKDALATTISSRKATFYSRSRSALWTKGETSMNFINVYDIFLDCDRDSIIYLGKPDGPTCHTGSDTCYFSSVFDLLKHPQSTISQRKAELLEPQNGKPSWTKRLLLDDKLLCSKIREEADELCRTLEENEDKARTASEMADVLYHSMVLLALRGVQIEEVLQVLRQRFFKSGIEEKESRKA
ncbi:Phosphoribosyl-AMP cyclohydrolase domain [Dillenia turbinata]|uniref:Phosphoribosyl-AMP cyclohydrolase domain n=1 Tax=Dillenia turbinata TaxID=194707 RepID=A0AAN8VSG5_9MAGN